LNFCFGAKAGAPGVHNVLKTAVLANRGAVVRAILERFPAVNFDVIHARLKVAEPLILSVQPSGVLIAADEVGALITAGEIIVSRYYEQLNLTLAQVLQNKLIPQLLTIVQDFAARIPRSTLKLELVDDAKI